MNDTHAGPPESFLESIQSLTGKSVPDIRKAVENLWHQFQGQEEVLPQWIEPLWARATAHWEWRFALSLLAGALAGVSGWGMAFLRETVSKDPDWRVQEALAKGLDWCCHLRGFEACVPLLRSWLRDADANVRRAAAEGPRVWTKRSYFGTHPEVALELLGLAKADPEEYVRKAVGNAVSDIGKTHPGLVLETLRQWRAHADPAGLRVIRRACRSLLKSHPREVAELLEASG